MGKDPTAFMPDLLTYGGLYDSIPSYAKQMGLKVISAYDQGFLNPDRANGGYVDGKEEQRKPFHLSSGDMSHREFADWLAKDGLIFGRTTITNSMSPGTKDCSPIPSDSACIQHRRHLTADLTASDTLIYIDDPTYMNEIACWEGHCKELNMVKIGKELIHYLGVSDTKPYRLLNVTRGYWNTQPSVHKKGDNVDKMQVTVGWAYQGLVPNLELQDELGKLYADMAANSGIGYYDLDGQEFLFHSGFGSYSVKRFSGVCLKEPKSWVYLIFVLPVLLCLRVHGIIRVFGMLVEVRICMMQISDFGVVLPVKVRTYVMLLMLIFSHLHLEETFLLQLLQQLNNMNILRLQLWGMVQHTV